MTKDQVRSLAESAFAYFLRQHPNGNHREAAVESIRAADAFSGAFADYKAGKGTFAEPDPVDEPGPEAEAADAEQASKAKAKK